MSRCQGYCSHFHSRGSTNTIYIRPHICYCSDCNHLRAMGRLILEKNILLEIEQYTFRIKGRDYV